MKGIAHFAAGIAVTSCFPEAVAQGMAGNPLPFIVGGAAALLPDTLDFRFSRFLHRYDVEIVPDPKRFEPGMVASGVAAAAGRALATGRRVSVKLHTAQLGADKWLKYGLRFDVAGRRAIVANRGAIEGMEALPAPGATPAGPREASAPFPCDIRLEYESEIDISILDGPVLGFTPAADGRSVRVEFLPWHRVWSHGVPMAAATGAAGWLIGGPWTGLIAFSALMSHVALDQLGFMGGSTLYPFVKSRTAGRRLMHSGDPAPNFWTVWLSCLVIFWNLHAASGEAVRGFNAARLFFYGCAAPAAIIWLARLLQARADKTAPARQTDAEGS